MEYFLNPIRARSGKISFWAKIGIILLNKKLQSLRQEYWSTEAKYKMYPENNTMPIF